ncbi:MAG: serine hydrolase domain-containing protein, partial [Candidatus Spyradocola sp.]
MLTFRHATPESVGIPSDAVAAFVRDLLDARHCLHTISIIKDGALIFEGAFSPMTLDEPHRMYSCSKSFVSVAIGLAQSEGLLRLTDRVAQFFPEYDTPDLHPWLKSATLRDMLRMTDCHSHNTYNMEKNPPD